MKKEIKTLTDSVFIINKQLKMNYLKKSATLLSFFIPFLLFSCSEDENKNECNNPYNLDLICSYEEYLQTVNENSDNELIDIETINNIILDIRYATDKNFTGNVVYTAPKAFARKPVVKALGSIQEELLDSGLALIIYDAYRPYAATLKFYEVYPDTNFVAAPWYGSRHNRGCAVDISLAYLENGKEIPMPTEFDDFSEKAGPYYEDIPDSAKANREFLIDIMKRHGFTVYPTEWWHYDYQGWENYKLMDIPFDKLQ